MIQCEGINTLLVVDPFDATSFSASALNDRYLLVFGGIASRKANLVSIFDVVGSKWTKSPLSEVTPDLPFGLVHSVEPGLTYCQFVTLIIIIGVAVYFSMYNRGKYVLKF